MKPHLIRLYLLCAVLVNFCHAQNGYQYNRPTGKPFSPTKNQIPSGNQKPGNSFKSQNQQNNYQSESSVNGYQYNRPSFQYSTTPIPQIQTIGFPQPFRPNNGLTTFSPHPTTVSPNNNSPYFSTPKGTSSVTGDGFGSFSQYSTTQTSNNNNYNNQAPISSFTPTQDYGNYPSELSNNINRPNNGNNFGSDNAHGSNSISSGLNRPYEGDNNNLGQSNLYNGQTTSTGNNNLGTNNIGNIGPNNALNGNTGIPITNTNTGSITSYNPEQEIQKPGGYKPSSANNIEPSDANGGNLVAQNSNRPNSNNFGGPISNMNYGGNVGLPGTNNFDSNNLENNSPNNIYPGNLEQSGQNDVNIKYPTTLVPNNVYTNNYGESNVFNPGSINTQKPNNIYGSSNLPESNNFSVINPSTGSIGGYGISSKPSTPINILGESSNFLNTESPNYISGSSPVPQGLNNLYGGNGGPQKPNNEIAGNIGYQTPNNAFGGNSGSQGPSNTFGGISGSQGSNNAFGGNIGPQGSNNLFVGTTKPQGFNNAFGESIESQKPNNNYYNAGNIGSNNIFGNNLGSQGLDNDSNYQKGDYSAIPGTPDKDYPILSEIPSTKFNCESQKYPGYYADVETRCQVFHICANGLKYDFLCPNGTIFHQMYFVCVWWNQFDCNTAESLYNLNENLYEYDKIGNMITNTGGVSGIQGPSTIFNQNLTSSGSSSTFNPSNRPQGPSVDYGSLVGPQVPSIDISPPTGPQGPSSNFNPSIGQQTTSSNSNPSISPQGLSSNLYPAIGAQDSSINFESPNNVQSSTSIFSQPFGPQTPTYNYGSSTASERPSNNYEISKPGLTTNFVPSSNPQKQPVSNIYGLPSGPQGPNANYGLDFRPESSNTNFNPSVDQGLSNNIGSNSDIQKPIANYSPIFNSQSTSSILTSTPSPYNPLTFNSQTPLGTYNSPSKPQKPSINYGFSNNLQGTTFAPSNSQVTSPSLQKPSSSYNAIRPLEESTSLKPPFEPQGITTTYTPITNLNGLKPQQPSIEYGLPSGPQSPSNVFIPSDNSQSSSLNAKPSSGTQSPSFGIPTSSKESQSSYKPSPNFAESFNYQPGSSFHSSLPNYDSTSGSNPQSNYNPSSNSQTPFGNLNSINNPSRPFANYGPPISSSTNYNPPKPSSNFASTLSPQAQISSYSTTPSSYTQSPFSQTTVSQITSASFSPLSNTQNPSITYSAPSSPSDFGVNFDNSQGSSPAPFTLANNSQKPLSLYYNQPISPKNQQQSINYNPSNYDSQSPNYNNPPSNLGYGRNSGNEQSLIYPVTSATEQPTSSLSGRRPTYSSSDFSHTRQPPSYSSGFTDNAVTPLDNFNSQFSSIPISQSQPYSTEPNLPFNTYGTPESSYSRFNSETTANGNNPFTLSNQVTKPSREYLPPFQSR